MWLDRGVWFVRMLQVIVFMKLNLTILSRVNKNIVFLYKKLSGQINHQTCVS